MHEVNHTNPYTNESMGSVFEHGVTVVADGGRREAVDAADDEDANAGDDAERSPDPSDDAEEDDAADEDDEDDERSPEPGEEPMKEVSHEAPSGGHGNRMFERVGDSADVEE